VTSGMDGLIRFLGELGKANKGGGPGNSYVVMSIVKLPKDLCFFY